ncbi:hypothetical protein DNTS_002701 [Danionella cerebrum]|uniref:INO80 complex subunit F domain-containing protein n=1 Tax=Danionella cerebrum TaxID=2873325 RepID=A0A553MKT9_9TELE|nr:hypothetical protein DNTS_002701 [Danionella translucida]TRY53790.1 hypothetical protein DNTS_002701 [Danionella translucida]TRY53791.1 hypothetical protein DNTS_002701 [Danionella translucida]
MMEDFSGLALPPLFGDHILEAELESGGVELDPSGSELLENHNENNNNNEQEDKRRELEKKKYQVLSRRCKEIEQVNEKILGRLHQVQRLTHSYGDDYRTAQLTISLEDEGKAVDPGVCPDEDVSSPPLPRVNTAGTKKKRQRFPKDRETQLEPEPTDTQFTGFPSPSSHSH